MAESRAVTVIPLNGSNYPTWKVQCWMALMKDGLWNILSGSEYPPNETEAEKYAKFVARRDHALAIIVLSVELSLLYLIGDPEYIFHSFTTVENLATSDATVLNWLKKRSQTQARRGREPSRRPKRLR